MAAGVEVVVNPVVTRKNLHLMDSFQDYALNELHAASISYGIIVPIGMGEKNWENLELPVKDYPKVFENATDKRVLPECSQPLSCKAGFNQLFVGVQGEVYPCHLFSDPKFSFGNLQHEGNTLETLYKSDKPGRKMFKEFPNQELTECQSCSQKRICGGGCRARAFVMSGDLIGKDSVACSRFLGVPLNL